MKLKTTRVGRATDADQVQWRSPSLRVRRRFSQRLACGDGAVRPEQRGRSAAFVDNLPETVAQTAGFAGRLQFANCCPCWRDLAGVELADEPRRLPNQVEPHP